MRSQWQVHVLIPKPMQLPKFASVLQWLHLDLWNLCRSIDLFRCQMNKIAQSPRCVTSGRGISLTLQHLEVTKNSCCFSSNSIFSTNQPPPPKKNKHIWDSKGDDISRANWLPASDRSWRSGPLPKPSLAADRYE